MRKALVVEVGACTGLHRLEQRAMFAAPARPQRSGSPSTNSRMGSFEQIWRNSLRDCVLPTLGHVRVDPITMAGVMFVLLPRWATKHETMRRIKQRLGRIFRGVVATGYRTDDPAGATLDAALPRNGRSTQHFAALPPGEVATAIAKVRNSGAWPRTKAAFELLVLTACLIVAHSTASTGFAGPTRLAARSSN